MIEFFNTLSSFWDKVVKLGEIAFNSMKSSFNEIITWLSLFPLEIISAGISIILIVIVYKILGRS
jgi:hypothetical protein